MQVLRGHELSLSSFTIIVFILDLIIVYVTCVLLVINPVPETVNEFKVHTVYHTYKTLNNFFIFLNLAWLLHNHT
jgi:hypothetical protein